MISGEEARRALAGECAEVVDEVRLIGISRIERELHPSIGVAASLDCFDDPLEAHNATERLGGNSNRCAEAARKLALADPQLLGERGDPQSSMTTLDRTSRGRHQIVPCDSGIETAHQGRLHHRDTLGGGSRQMHPLLELTRESIPDILESNHTSRELVHRKPHEGMKPAGMESYAEEMNAT